MGGYASTYNELMQIANEEFEDVLENADASNFFELIDKKAYSNYLGRYYRNKSLEDLYETRILVVPKNGYITQRLVYLSPELTGGTVVGTQAINITEQNGSINLRNAGAVNFCPLSRFFESLCYAFGIHVDKKVVDIYSLCNEVLSDFEFVYNRENGLSIEINSVTYNNVYILYILEDDKTYFDEDLVQAFANTMYRAGWFEYGFDISTTNGDAGDYLVNISEMTYEMCVYYWELYKRTNPTDYNRIDDFELINSCLTEFKNRFPEQLPTKLYFYSSRQGQNMYLRDVCITGSDAIPLDVPVQFNRLNYFAQDNDKAWTVSTNTYSNTRLVARRETLTDLSSEITYIVDTPAEALCTPYRITTGFQWGSSINITVKESSQKGITIVDSAKLPSGTDSLPSDYENWFSRLKNIVGTAVEEIGESLRNIFNVIEFVPLTLLTADLNPPQEEVHTGVVLVPDSTPILPEPTIKFLTPLPKTNKPIPQDEPYIPPEGIPEPNPTNPPPIGGVTPPIPDNPIVDASNGLFTVYNPTKSQLNDFGGYLWGEDIVGILQSIFQNPIDGVISLHIIYATPETGDEVPIRVGYLTSTANAKKVVEQYINIDCGTIDVPEYYGNVLDYAPYTRAHIYLPFIGIREINVNEIMGSQVNVNYKIDVLTGSVYASISVFRNAISQVLYVFEGNGGVQLPLTGGNMSRILSGVISGIAFGAIGGGVVGAVAGATGGLLRGASVSKSGSVGANAGAMGIKKPYIMITYSQAYMANNYNQQYGYPSNVTTQLSACKGYTRVKEVHVENILVATQEEKDMIQTLLKQGVIIE